MKRTLIAAHSPVYGDLDKKSVKLQCMFLEIRHMGYVEFWAHPNDIEPHGRNICRLALKGCFGEIAPCPYTLEDLLIQTKQSISKLVDEAAEKLMFKAVVTRAGIDYENDIEDCRVATLQFIEAATSQAAVTIIYGAIPWPVLPVRSFLRVNGASPKMLE